MSAVAKLRGAFGADPVAKVRSRVEMRKARRPVLVAEIAAADESVASLEEERRLASGEGDVRKCRDAVAAARKVRDDRRGELVDLDEDIAQGETELREARERDERAALEAELREAVKAAGAETRRFEALVPQLAEVLGRGTAAHRTANGLRVRLGIEERPDDFAFGKALAAHRLHMIGKHGDAHGRGTEEITFAVEVFADERIGG